MNLSSQEKIFGYESKERCYALPALIVRLGEKPRVAYMKFLVQRFPNSNTRRVYALALARFFDWCDGHRIPIANIGETILSAYFTDVRLSGPQQKQFRSAVTSFINWTQQRDASAHLTQKVGGKTAFGYDGVFSE